MLTKSRLLDAFRLSLVNQTAPVLAPTSLMISLPLSLPIQGETWTLYRCTSSTVSLVDGRLVGTFEIEYENESEYPKTTQ